jgi:hypothetical protein
MWLIYYTFIYLNYKILKRFFLFIYKYYWKFLYVNNPTAFSFRGVIPLSIGNQKHLFNRLFCSMQGTLQCILPHKQEFPYSCGNFLPAMGKAFQPCHNLPAILIKCYAPPSVPRPSINSGTASPNGDFVEG